MTIDTVSTRYRAKTVHRSSAKSNFGELGPVSFMRYSQ